MILLPSPLKTKAKDLSVPIIEEATLAQMIEEANEKA